jgi:hypothetical protein
LMARYEELTEDLKWVEQGAPAVRCEALLSGGRYCRESSSSRPAPLRFTRGQEARRLVCRLRQHRGCRAAGSQYSWPGRVGTRMQRVGWAGHYQRAGR